MMRPFFSRSRNTSHDAQRPTKFELAISTRGASGCVLNTPTGLPDCTSRVSSLDRKSTRLNSSHEWISYAVFCLKKKKKTRQATKVMVDAQNEMLDYQQNGTNARLTSIMENTNLYKLHQVSKNQLLMIGNRITSG